MKNILFLGVLFTVLSVACANQDTRTDDKSASHLRPRVIVTSDGEIDDECSMVRFLLYANEWDVEGIITSSSQYHWHGHSWAVMIGLILIWRLIPRSIPT